MSTHPAPTIALLPWGDLIEDFLDSIGVSFERFCSEMTGGWLFGYIDALRLVGVRTVVFCVSARVTKTTRFTHKPTGATICVLPASKSYRRLRRRMIRPDGWTPVQMFGEAKGLRRRVNAVLTDIAPYLTTPVGPLARELRRERCRAIVCQEYEYARFDICVTLGMLLRIPVFATFQGSNFQLSRFEKLVRPLTLKGCAGLIIASQAQGERIRARYGIPWRKIARIFNPLDLTLWAPATPLERDAARAALDIQSTARVVVWHGRVDIHTKGLDVLLDAWSKVCHEHKGQDLRLLLIGTGDDASELHQRIAATQLASILWIDQYVLDREAMRRYLCAADVYVLPSRREGFPIAPIEAMACGLPVVAADAPGVPDIFEGGEAAGGLVVPHADAAALALALSRIIDNPDLGRRLGASAKHRVATSFSLPVVGEQLRVFLASRGSTL